MTGCPKCKGTGDVEWNCATIIKECPHCDGTGEIKNGDWWKCRIDCTDPDVDVDTFAMCLLRAPDGWLDEVERVSCFLDVDAEFTVIPICRMKEVI